MSVTRIEDGVLVTRSDADDAKLYPPVPVTPPAPQTVFAPADLMTALFTPAEQLGFASKPQGVLFIGLIAAHESVDIASAEFKADIAQAVAGGFLTQDRADQVLAGTLAPQETGT